MISSRSFFTRILAALAVLISVCYGGARLASGQYSPAGGNTFGGATYPLNVADAAGLTGPVPVSAGGTGVTSLQQGIAWTTPCSDPNVVAYGNGDTNVVPDSGTTAAVYSWTDICNGYVFTQSTNANQPTIQVGAVNGHSCIRYTVGTAQALIASNAAAFPALQAPFSFGIFGLFARSNPGQIAAYMDFPANAAQGTISLYHATAGSSTCKFGLTVIEPAAFYNPGYFPAFDMCIIEPVVDAGSYISHAYEQGGSMQALGNSPPTATSTDGGLTLGNYFGGSSTDSADGLICDWFVFKTAATQLEQRALVSYIHTRLGI